MKTTSILVVFFIIIFYVSCSDQKEPDSSHDNAGITQPTKIIQIVVDQEYSKAEEVTLPFFDRTKIMLEKVGFKVVGRSSNVFDDILKIKVRGVAIGKNYTNSYGYSYQHLYSGAAIIGKISVSGLSSMELEFKGYVSPPGSFNTFQGDPPYKTPNNAPFRDAFYKSDYFFQLSKIVTNIWGIDASYFLITNLKPANSDICWSVAEALVKIGHPTVEPLIAALKDRVIVNEAAWALGEIKDQRAVEPLIILLKDYDGYVRESAARSLGKIKDPRAVAPLIGRLKYDGYSAADALSKIGESAVVPLITELKNRNSSVRTRAAEALGKIKDPRAVVSLFAALEDKERDVRYAAGTALTKITGYNFDHYLSEKNQRWWEENKNKYLAN